jgi:protein SCO1/2
MIIQKTTPLLILCLILHYTFAGAQAVRQNDPALNNIDVIEHIGDQIPLDIEIVREDNSRTTLREYFSDSNKPVILTLVYYNCPMLCNYLLNGLVDELKQMTWTPGADYNILTVSINPSETPDLAAAKKDNYLSVLNKQGSEAGWSFNTGDEEQIKALANAVGFIYYYDEKSKEFAHPAVLTILTPQGKISRYLYGLTHRHQDIKFALLEASEGHIGTTVDKLLLYCYQYDPDARGYVLFAGRVMRIGGIIMLLLIVLFLLFLWKGELKYRIRLLKSAKTG